MMKDILEIEILKLRNSKILWIVTLAPLFMVVQGTTNLLRYYDLFTGQGQNVWEQLYTQSMILYVSVLLPVLISVVMTCLARLENANNGWKQYLSLPVERGKIYGAKFILGCGLILLNILVLILGLVGAGKIIGVSGAIPLKVLLQPLATFVAAMPIMVLLYVLSLKFSHLALPLGVGIGLSLPAMVVANTKYWLIYPWTYPIMAALGGDFDVFSKGSMVYLISLVLLIFIFAIGYREFTGRDIV